MRTPYTFRGTLASRYQVARRFRIPPQVSSSERSEGIFRFRAKASGQKHGVRQQVPGA